MAGHTEFTQLGRANYSPRTRLVRPDRLFVRLGCRLGGRDGQAASATSAIANKVASSAPSRACTDIPEITVETYRARAAGSASRGISPFAFPAVILCSSAVTIHPRSAATKSAIER